MRRGWMLRLVAASTFAALLTASWFLTGTSSATPRAPGGSAARAWSGLRTAPIKNTGFAGYRHNGGSANASFNVKAEFVVPKLAACGPATRAIAPDIDVAAGKKGSEVGLFVGCYQHRPDYFPFIDDNNTNTNYAAGVVQPGDHIVLRLSEGPSSSELTFQDLTHNLVKVKTGGGLHSLGFPGIGDASWIIKGIELGVPNFGTISFSNCTVNGVALGAGGSAKSPAVLQYDRATKAGTIQISTGSLSANTAFTTYFKHG